MGLTTTEYIELEAALKQAGFVHGKWDDKYISSDKLKSLPVADVRPVVRGEWERVGNTDHFKCTCCNNMILATWDMPSELFNFCPNCGADMRGG